MMDRVMPGLKQIFLNGNKGHPLLHKTCPGDRHLTKELLSIVEEFEKAIGKEIVNAVVFDGEGCSIDVFKTFDKLNKGRKNKFYLRNANRRQKEEAKEKYQMRCALVKKEDGKLTTIATTAPNEDIDSGAELANLYYDRWPCQEAKFKEMTRYCNLKVNHGFNKVVILREKEREHDRMKSHVSKLMEKKRKEVVKWKEVLENTPFYERDTEMDHIMTNFKILHENSLLFAKDVLFEGSIGMELMNRQFINHYGDLEILDGGKRFRFCEAFLIKLFLKVY